MSAWPALQPDIILMDLQMPEINGIEATRQILAASPQIRILMVTSSPTRQNAHSTWIARPAWWRYFYVRTLSPAELIGEPDALGGLTGGDMVGQIKKSAERRVTDWA